MKKHTRKRVMADIKIFRMNDCEWYAAETAEDALKAMADNLCFEVTPEGIAAMRKEYEVGEPIELTELYLDRLRFNRTNEDGETEETCTYREQLASMIADGEDFPCFFASTEY